MSATPSGGAEGPRQVGAALTQIEQYATALDNLLVTLRNLKASGLMVEGVPTEALFNFARSEISGLAQGFKTKDECQGCADCCVAPIAIVPAQGLDGGVARPLSYVLKRQRQPCGWLRGSQAGGFKCILHASKEKPFTCFSYQCASRVDLESRISNAEKGVGNTTGEGAK